MIDKALVGITSIPVIGMAAQWLAWRFKVPSILLLLLSGILVGPVFHLIQPDELMGPILFPLVSISVSIILFEGGLSLKFSDIKESGSVVRNLLMIGSLVTFVLIALAADYFLALPIQLSVLLGAILIVTGPTVIIPLFRQIKVKRQLASILRWEGIVIDPIGAMLAVLVFEIIIAGGSEHALGLAVVVIASTLVTGLVLGGLAALFVVLIIKNRWVPEYLQEGLTLMSVIGVNAMSGILQHESGLLSVTVMGIILANQNVVTIKHIIIFKENLTVILLSALFVILAAQIDIGLLTNYLSLKTVYFLLAVVFVARPASVFLSTMQSNLTFKEKIFLSSIAPRGIVAAAVASLFALRLANTVDGAMEIIPITFLVIVVTVIWSSLIGKPLAKLLDLKPKQKQVLLVGAHDWSRNIAKVLHSLGVQVTLIDTNKNNVIVAKEMGLTVMNASVLSKKTLENLEGNGFGKLLAWTSSDETNLLALMEYADVLGPSNVFRLYPKDRKKDLFTKFDKGHFLFDKGITHTLLTAQFTAGASVKAIILSKGYTYEDFLKKNSNAMPLFIVNRRKQLMVITELSKIKPIPGQILVALMT